MLVIISLVTVSITLSYCSASRKAAKAKTTFDGNLLTLIQGNCAPCHVQGGNKTMFDNYANVTKGIDEMIRRIELNPGERGFMPFRKSEKLPEDVIAVFKKWKDDGMLQN